MTQSTVLEAEVIEGLETFVIRELRTLDAQAVILLEGKGLIQFKSHASLQRLLQSRTIIALYALLEFDLPRPKALMGHQHFQRILNAIQLAFKNPTASAYQTLYIDAAGSDSSVMQRIKQELADAVGLQASESKGDLHIRIRKGRAHKGWDVLVRLTPRPLATREWRVANYEGALNGTVAHIMTTMILQPALTDKVLNLACGSGSLLIERALYDRQHSQQAAQHLTGVDNDVFALDCAAANLEAAATSQIQLVQADARQLPFASGTFTHLYADLPFGQRVGSHEENVRLYPELLKEAARIAAKNAQFGLITHEKRLMQRILSDRNSANWRLVHEYPINLSGLHPQIYLLKRL